MWVLIVSVPDQLLFFLLCYNGKSGNWQFLLSHCRYLDFFTEMFLE